jgi:hypothetical protein
MGIVRVRPTALSASPARLVEDDLLHMNVNAVVCRRRVCLTRIIGKRGDSIPNTILPCPGQSRGWVVLADIVLRAKYSPILL